MAGNANEPGGPPQSEGRDAGGPADRDRLVEEHREDPRVPFEARRDDLRGDREGDGTPAAGGQHRHAGAPAAQVGRQAGHQERGERTPRPFVPTERAVVGSPHPDRPRGAVEDRSDRGEPQEAQVVCLGTNVRTAFGVPTRTTCAIPRKRPWPTTPGIPAIALASFAAPWIGPKAASRI